MRRGVSTRSSGRRAGAGRRPSALSLGCSEGGDRVTGPASPRISVIVPCYNLGQHLAEAVDSVLVQTCQDFEVFVVDDGSTDAETQNVIRTFHRPRTRVMRIPHAGLAAARN